MKLNEYGILFILMGNLSPLSNKYVGCRNETQVKKILKANFGYIEYSQFVYVFYNGRHSWTIDNLSKPNYVEKLDKFKNMDRAKLTSDHVFHPVTLSNFGQWRWYVEDNKI